MCHMNEVKVIFAGGASEVFNIKHINIYMCNCNVIDMAALRNISMNSCEIEPLASQLDSSVTLKTVSFFNAYY